jgi:hypothetical protein
MTTFELLDLLNNADSALSHDDIHWTLRAINEIFQTTRPLLNEVLQASIGEQHSALEALKRKGGDLQLNLQAFGIGRAFRSIHSLQSKIQGNPVLLTLEDPLEDFDKSFEDFVGLYEEKAALQLMLQAGRMQDAIESTGRTIKFLLKSLISHAVIPEGNKELSLFLGSATSYHNTVVKMTAVEGMYSELCRLLGVSESEHPLQIVKIEAGSLWMKIFGESRVITFMISAIEGGVSFLHRNFTKDGRLREIPNNAETIMSLVGMSQALENRGIDTGELNEGIRLSAVKLANNLNQLLRGEPTVDVNGQRYSISQQMEERFLRESRSLFLESGETESHDIQDGSASPNEESAKD